MPNPIPPLPSSPQSKTDDAMSSAETSSTPTPRPEPTEANPWRMLVIGTVSLITAIAVTPAVACFLYPLLTTTEFKEGVAASEQNTSALDTPPDDSAVAAGFEGERLAYAMFAAGTV